MLPQIRMFHPHASGEALRRVNDVLLSGWLGEGPVVADFETAVAEMVGTPYCVAVNSGTSALHLALKIANIRPGDEVITTAQTMLATSQAILAVGGVPVFADIEFETGNLDANDLHNRFTERTAAVLAVDWAGYPCDWDSILSFCRTNGISPIDDAAHAFGASYRGKPLGVVCPITCFSFQAVKSLTTGDGGMLCVSNAEQRDRARALRWFGMNRAERRPSVLGDSDCDVVELGYKYHMNDIAAAIGLGNLAEFANQQRRRAEIAQRYTEALAGTNGLTLFHRSPDRTPSHWLYCLHVEERERFCQMMRAAGIATTVTNRRIDRYSLLGGQRMDLPNLRRFDASFIAIPAHPLLSDGDVERVIRTIRNGW